jgi:hypothetical protein
MHSFSKARFRNETIKKKKGDSSTKPLSFEITIPEPKTLHTNS